MTSQPSPAAPVPMNAHSQPNRTVMNGTTSGVMIAPTFVPALKMPVASARSRRGNHSATVLIAAGELPASPRPRTKRARRKPATDAPDFSPNTASSADIGAPYAGAHALEIAARDHTVSANAYPFFVPNRSMSRPANRNPIAYAS